MFDWEILCRRKAGLISFQKLKQHRKIFKFYGRRRKTKAHNPAGIFSLWKQFFCFWQQPSRRNLQRKKIANHFEKWWNIYKWHFLDPGGSLVPNIREYWLNCQLLPSQTSLRLDLNQLQSFVCSMKWRIRH